MFYTGNCFFFFIERTLLLSSQQDKNIIGPMLVSLDVPLCRSPDIKQLLDEVFFDIRNSQGRGKCFQLKPKAEADNTYRDLDYSGYHKNRI